MELKQVDVVQVRQTHTNLVENVHQETGISNSESLQSAENPELDLSAVNSELSEKIRRQYESIVGTLLYLAANSLPVLCLATGLVGSHVSDLCDRQVAGSGVSLDIYGARGCHDDIRYREV